MSLAKWRHAFNNIRPTRYDRKALNPTDKPHISAVDFEKALKMNLCGGIDGVTDHEWVLRLPEDELSVSSWKKKSSSASSKRDKLSFERSSLRRQSSSSSRHSSRSSKGSCVISSNHISTPTSASSMPNPVSRHGYEKQKTKYRSHTSRGLKSASILTRKLESGFNLTWINGGGKTQAVNMVTNSDKSYLRIRMRSRDEEESENDGSKFNQRDVKIKIRHIARVGSEKDTISEKGRDHSNSSNRSQNKAFIIRMKKNVTEYSKLKFLAQSPAERDSVVLAIRNLLDQGKQAHGSRRSKSPTFEHETRSNEFNLKSFKALQISDKQDEMVAEDADGLNLSIPNSLVNSKDNNKILADSRDDNGTERLGKSVRDAEETFNRSIERHSTGQKNGFRAASDTPNHKFTASKKVPTIAMLKRNKPSSWMEKKMMDSNGKISKKTFSLPEKDRQQNTLRMHYDKDRTRSPKMMERRRNQEESDTTKPGNGTKDHRSYDSLPFTPIECHSQVLSAVEDEDIANLAANFTNPATGPWCTDDICTASLKDFADSMTGIFDLKDNRNANGRFTNNGNQRAIAEEYISGFLSNNTNMSELLSVKDLWNVAATKHATGKEVKKMRLHNRARTTNGKAKRLVNLRKQMTFEGADIESTAFLQTISSFDDIYRKGKVMEDPELLYYDSDPEDAREYNRTRGPRLAIAQREEYHKVNTKRREALDILDTSRFGLGRRRRLGQDVLSDIIEATKNEKLSLLWHPAQNSESNNVPSLCVNVWVESGVYLTDGTFLLPKLTWLPAHEKRLDVRVLNVSDNSPGSLELLDVCRVRECQSIDRTSYPFARVDRSFVIQTQNAKYMFEAQSKQERGRVVNGLKLVIARLASLLMLKDLRAVDEFFGGNAVPGEAPVWARGYEKNGSTGDFPPA